MKQDMGDVHLSLGRKSIGGQEVVSSIDGFSQRGWEQAPCSNIGIF